MQRKWNGTTNCYNRTTTYIVQYVLVSVVLEWRGEYDIYVKPKA